MCYTPILPATAQTGSVHSPLLDLTYVFNRWLRMLISYGKLDAAGLRGDFTAIAKVIKNKDIPKNIRQAVMGCRDYALSGTGSVTGLVGSLHSALNLMCKAQESDELRKIRKGYADQGMTELYRPLSRRLAREKIRKLGKGIIYTDIHTDDAATTRLVRRIVEKRAAQQAHKNAARHYRESKRYRHSIKRAASFNFYNMRFADYNADLRTSGTHWKVRIHHTKGRKVLVAKHSYNTYDEAVEACGRYMAAHPYDTRPVSAYRCEHCGKWHIGHDRTEMDLGHAGDTGIPEAS